MPWDSLPSVLAPYSPAPGTGPPVLPQGLGATLLPIAYRCFGYIEPVGKLGLGQSSAFSQFFKRQMVQPPFCCSNLDLLSRKRVVPVSLQGQLYTPFFPRDLSMERNRQTFHHPARGHAPVYHAWMAISLFFRGLNPRDKLIINAL